MSWIETVRKNAMIFVEKSKAEFKKGLVASSTHLPENNSQNRAMILNDFLDSAVGFVVETAVEYGNTSAELEQTIIDSIKFKFEHLRGNDAKKNG